MLSFDFFYDIRFWLMLVVVALVYRLTAFNRVGKTVILLLSSVLMILALPRFNLISFAFLLAIGLLTYLAGYQLNTSDLSKSTRKRTVLSFGGILFLILCLAFFKYRFFQSAVLGHLFPKSLAPTDYIFIIGISYISFKMIHFLIEAYKQQLKNLSLTNFVSYLFFFPAFISGPINRYNHFSEQLAVTGVGNWRGDLRNGTERIIHGLFKKVVLAAICLPYAIVNIGKPPSEMTWNEVILGLYAYTFYVYFDFSGYSDLAIGSARIMGIKLPENFNNPFLKPNIQQLWASWHMSLTRWLTDYIYWPLSKKLRGAEYLRKKPVLLSNISIIVTFIICGMWHGEPLNFVVWGLYHGFGLAILNVYQKQKRRIRDQRIKKYFLSRYSRWIGVVCTFNFFVLGILLFSFDINSIRTLLVRMF